MMKILILNMPETFKHSVRLVEEGDPSFYDNIKEIWKENLQVFCVIQTLRKLQLYEARFSKNTRDQIERIKLKLGRLQAISKIADARQHEDDRIRDWVGKTREVAYDSEELFDIFSIEMSMRNERNFLRKPSEKKLKTLNDIESKISSQETSWKSCNIGPISLEEMLDSVSVRRQQIRRTYSHHEVVFVGLDEDIKQLVAQVVNEDGGNCCHVISIIGMGGIGKTALARRVYHHEDVRCHFHAFAWAIISRQWQPEEVLQRILCKLVPEKSAKFSTMNNISELIKELFEVQKTRKCLVVLDDVCETDVWDSLRPAFPNRKLGSKVLLTTRKKEVALHIDTDTRCHLYEQRRLSEEESWELLQKKAFPLINLNISVENDYASGGDLEDETSSRGSFRSCQSVEENDEFSGNLNTTHSEAGIEDIRADITDESAARVELGKLMVRECGGLPLAIIILGGIMIKKSTFSEWEAMHESCISHMRERGIGDNGGAYELLALSYHDLPYQIKQCFWHLGDFPRYHYIPTRKIYQLWAAEGFILPDSYPGEDHESIMDVAERHLFELEQRCMVQVQVEESTGRLKSCQLHDFVREICILKEQEENFRKRIHLPQESDFSMSSSSSSDAASTISSATRALSIPIDSYSEMNLTSEQDNLEHVRSAIFFSRPKERKKNLQTTLKLLCNNFKLLRVLDLERFDFGEELSEAIGNLVHLRYLSLRGSRFNKLPSSIGNLKFLQTLDLRVSFDSCLTIPDVLWKLNHLRHLYLPPFQNSTNKLQLHSLIYLEILKNFDPRISDFRDIPRLTKLRKLTVIFCVEAENLKAINKYLRNSSNCLSESSFRIHYYFKTEKELNLLEQLVGCVHLRKLDLVGQIGKLPEHYQFSQRLTKLTLRSSILKEDPLAILEKLPKLYSLILRRDAYAGRRLSCSAHGFCQLRTIEFQGLSSLESWIIEEGSMPNLLHITIDKCTKLNMLPEGIKFLTIRELVIANMPEAFKQTVEAGANNSYKVTFTDTNRDSMVDSEHHQVAGHDKIGLLRTFSPSLVPKTWQNQ